MSNRAKFFVAMIAAAMILVPGLASAKRTLQLEQRMFSGVNWTKAPSLTSQATADVLGIRITTTGLTYIEGLVNNVLQDTVLANFLDCTVRQMLDADIQELTCGADARMGCLAKTPTEVSCTDTNNYAYIPAAGGPYEANFLFNSCETVGAISIPMVGTICLAVKLANIDPLASGETKIIDFKQVKAGGGAGKGTPYLQMSAGYNLVHSSDNAMSILVHLDSIQVDLRIEPPYALTDIYPTHSDGSSYVGYDASQDYSNYVKAWGRIAIPSVEVALSIRALGRYDDYAGDATKSPHLRDLGLDLFGLYMDLGLEYVIVPGPYCNNFTAEDSTVFNWTSKCQAPCGGCPIPNVEGLTTDTPGETGGCTRSNLDAMWPGNKVSANCDDPVLPNSEMIGDVIPFLDAHLMMVARNTFTGTNPWAYLDWYIGPTRLLSLNPLMECISIDNPLTIETDLIMINLGFNTEFWADSAGLIIPGDFALDFQYYEDRDGDNKNFSPMTSCVEVRSFSMPITSMSKPSTNMCVAGNACDDFINYGSQAIVTGGACSANDTNCSFLGVCPAGTGQFCNGSPAIIDYHIGIGVHQNMISSIIYDAITTGILCLWLDKEVITRDLGKLSSSGLDVEAMLSSSGMDITSLLGQVFTTDIFALMVPDLSLYWPSADMAIEIVPAVTYPRAQIAGEPGPAPFADYANPITNEPPYAKVGKLELNYTYTVSGSTQYHQHITTNDLAIVVPHLNLNFYVYNDATIDQLYIFNTQYNNQQAPGANLYGGKRYTATPLGTPMRAFGLDLGATIGIDLNLLNKVANAYVLDFATAGAGGSTVLWPRAGQDLTAGYHKLGTTYLANDAGWNAATRQYKFPVYTYPGGIMMQTGRVIDITAVIDPAVRFYLEYWEMTSVANGWSDNWRYAVGPPDFYNDVLGNLLPTLLSGLIATNVDLGFDIGRMMNTPFAINGVNAPINYSKTSSFLNPNNPAPFTGAGNGAGIFPAGPNMDKRIDSMVPAWPRIENFATGADSGPRNLGLADPDWLGIFINLEGRLTAKALLAIVAPMLSGFTSGGGTESITGSFGSFGAGGEGMSIMNLNINDVLGALGAALGGVGSLLGLGSPPACSSFADSPATNIDDSHNGHYSWSPCSPFSQSYFEVLSNYYPPETTVHQPEAVDARGTLITFDAVDDKDSDGRIMFSYRLDKGFWSPWSTQRFAALKGLLEGQHLLEVRSLDTDGNIEPTPAAMAFRVDSIPPTLSLSGNVRGSSATFVADVRDFQTKPEEIQIAYRLDEGSWSEYGTSKKIELTYLSDGTHTLGVKAIDKTGNEAIATQAFNVTPETTFGCSTVPTSGSALLLLLFVPGFLILRRRIGR